jgi:hypothetical protein
MTNERNEWEDRFLVEGVRRAGEAFQVLNTFEPRMAGRLVAILKDKMLLEPLARTGEPKVTQKYLHGPAPWLEACIPANLRNQKLTLCLGVWWNSPASSSGILYANVLNANARSAALRVGTDLGDIKLLENRWLYLEHRPDMDLDRDLNRLLDALIAILPGSLQAEAPQR